MRKLNYFILLVFIFCAGFQLQAQETKPVQKATLILTSEQMVEVPSIASQIEAGTFKPAENIAKEFNPKKWGKNTAVPGKGLPKGNDPLWDQQMKVAKSPGKAPILTFEAASASATPTDPTGAVGPNHFVNSWNSSFRIFNKSGSPLIPASSLGTIFPGETDGDPIVMYDRYADRFIVTEFAYNGAPYGFLVAISQGPDPVNDGWYTYFFQTDAAPDYPKFSVWSDGYYITANKNSSTAGTSEVVFVIERDQMLTGAAAQMVGFPLTNIVTSGFYSPLGFNCNGIDLPPAGNAPIVYMQDDVWSGVSTDHLKIWNINVNWTSPASSTISSPQMINTAPFDGLFDNGSFSNLPQPSGLDVDALQATIMYMAQYRRFTGYNSAVFNFVVDLDGGDDHAGIRWYELRQNSDGAAWYIYQEGTYAQPDGHSAFSGNMCMDGNGNIALAYTSVSSTLYPSLRYTGRYASDPLGTMPIAESVILNGTQIDPYSRYGDYSQMTIDPTDDATFWSIAEVFNSSSRKNHVGVFQFGAPSLTAAFSGSPLSVCSGGSVIYTDQSLGSPTLWNWTFSGGTPGSYNGQNPPAITYNAPGTYTVSLIVGDGSSTDTETKTGYISVSDIIVDFSGTPQSVFLGNSVTFTDMTSCNPTSWDWSFPGGSPLTFVGQTPPPITYDVAGSYSVSLNASNGMGSATETKSNFISVIFCTYCAAGGSTGDEEWVSNVMFNTIDNSSGAATGYTDYTSISTNVDLGSNYTLSVSCGSTGTWTENYWVYFDWNQDCDFDDAGESFDLGQTTGPGTLSQSIPIPGDAMPGATRMRVFVEFSSDPSDGCATYTYGEAEDYTINILAGHVTLDLKAYLEGAYNGTNMDAAILPYLPLSQPFSMPIWNYSGTESVGAIPNPDVVEWVLIDVRDAASVTVATSATSVAKQAAFILRDGSIVDMDGISNLTFDVSISQNMYVVVWQRNHLGIISNNALPSSGGVYTYDFTTGINQVYGSTAGHKQLLPGVWGMYGGDGNHNGQVEINDKANAWEVEAGEKGYFFGDYNLDGEANNQDKDDVWVPNMGSGTQVPN